MYLRLQRLLKNNTKNGLLSCHSRTSCVIRTGCSAHHSFCLKNILQRFVRTERIPGLLREDHKSWSELWFRSGLRSGFGNHYSDRDFGAGSGIIIQIGTSERVRESLFRSGLRSGFGNHYSDRDFREHIANDFFWFLSVFIKQYKTSNQCSI